MPQQESTRAELIEEIAILRREVEILKPLSARTEEAEDEFARFFAQSLDLLCIAGFDEYFKRLNPAWVTALGWTLEQLKARPIRHFLHPDDRAATLAQFAQLGKGTETLLFENRYRHRDGSYRWLRWNARAMPGRRRVYASARDVTGQKRLERQGLEIADLEQERLGRELHDGLCQTLAGIAALSASLSKRLAVSCDCSASAAAEIGKLLNEAIGEARDLARGLGPVGLDEAGVDGALEALALRVQHRFRVACTVDCDRPVVRLRREVAAHLFRIAQEAVNNAVAHGRAERIEIRLTSEDGRGLLRVGDDGIGLPVAARNRDGAGLHTMATRARLIGGTLEVRQRARRGTVVSCAFPLPSEPDTGK